ncbi:thioredoxin family protein [Runella salmonicolor]|uniref:Thioredoxin family protein n=1 Tax=Runella salmonicolor TaxID=2950278 RepID=A0ABT1FYQ5_9BACT|nr:thioredoxin family protein [Runella salmonicolor]MCP1385833.1 thioredoxin family protein [Runella salmonicolor]
MKQSVFAFVMAATLFTTIGFIQPKAGYQVGDKVMNFNLKNVDGKTVSLDGNSSVKGYIVVFTCNTCPVAQAYEDRIIALDKKYASEGYPVIAINANDAALSSGDSFEEMKKRAARKSYGFAYLTDETQEVAKTYGARNTPTVFVVKRSGNDFILAYTGAIDNNTQDATSATEKYVQNAVDALLKDKTVSVPTTKAIGCGIKWKKA